MAHERPPVTLKNGSLFTYHLAEQGTQKDLYRIQLFNAKGELAKEFIRPIAPIARESARISTKLQQSKQCFVVDTRDSALTPLELG